MNAREHNAREMAKKDGRNFDALDKTMKNAYLHNADVEMARQPESTGSTDKLAPGGLLFSLTGKRTDTDIAVLWERAKRLGVAKMKFPHTVTMPCGNQAIFDDAEHIQGLGIEDIRCRCGDPDHYIVKFEDLRGAEVEGKKTLPRELKHYEYLCTKCQTPHRNNSQLGKKHLKYKDGTDDSSSGTGQPDTIPGSANTGEPE